MNQDIFTKNQLFWLVMILFWIFWGTAAHGESTEWNLIGYTEKETCFQKENFVTREVESVENNRMADLSIYKGRTESKRFTWLLLTFLALWNIWKNYVSISYYQSCACKALEKNANRVGSRRGPPDR